MEELLRHKGEWMALARLVAAAVVEQTSPAEAEISISEAGKRYGQRWINKQIQLNLLSAHRRGAAKNSPKFINVLEIEALRQSELTTTIK